MRFECLSDAVAYFFNNPMHCRQLWIKARWPNGIRCPHCDMEYHPRQDVEQMHCRGCYRYFTVITGTILRGTRLPLAAWFTVIWAFTYVQSPSGRLIAAALGARRHHAYCRAKKIVRGVCAELRESGSWRDGDRFETLLRGCTVTKHDVVTT